MKKIHEIDAAIKKICPIEGVNSDGVISFCEEATEHQRDMAIALMQQWLAEPEDEEKETALARIFELEFAITPRRRDEAILGEDGGWLANQRAQIKALRDSLQGKK